MKGSFNRRSPERASLTHSDSTLTGLVASFKDGTSSGPTTAFES